MNLVVVWQKVGPSCTGGGHCQGHSFNIDPEPSSSSALSSLPAVIHRNLINRNEKHSLAVTAFERQFSCSQILRWSVSVGTEVETLPQRDPGSSFNIFIRVIITLEKR